MADLPGPPAFSILVPHPTLKIVLTQPRESDGEAVIAGLNHPSVYMNLNGAPYPYTESDWATRWTEVSGLSEANLKQLQAIQEEEQSSEAARDWTKRKWIGSKWTSTIREVIDSQAAPIDGKFIGEIAVQRETFIYLADADEMKRRADENNKLESGDPNTIWTIGYWLIPEYQGRGVMPAVVKSLMAEMIVPFMNAHKIQGGYFEQNLASKRVFEKCGFTFVALHPDVVPVNPNKINGVQDVKVGIGMMEWQRESSNVGKALSANSS